MGFKGYKAKCKLAVDDYLFLKEKQKANGLVYWTCEDKYCKARLHTRGDRIVK